VRRVLQTQVLDSGFPLQHNGRTSVPGSGFSFTPIEFHTENKIAMKIKIHIMIEINIMMMISITSNKYDDGGNDWS
jgi:hypothetical protein